jgi:hypothetical protein
MNNAVSKSDEADEYDIEKETAASRSMLEQRIPAKLNAIKLALVEIYKRHAYEPWRLNVMIDLVESIERNCGELLETFDKNKLPAAAWIARNLLELLVWAKYCGVSKENAWRFHEDALRDIKGLLEIHAKNCEALGIENNTAALAAQRVKDIAFEKLGWKISIPSFPPWHMLQKHLASAWVPSSRRLTDSCPNSRIQRPRLCTVSRTYRKCADICKRPAQREAYISRRRVHLRLKRILECPRPGLKCPGS